MTRSQLSAVRCSEAARWSQSSPAEAAPEGPHVAFVRDRGRSGGSVTAGPRPLASSPVFSPDDHGDEKRDGETEHEAGPIEPHPPVFTREPPERRPANVPR